MSKMMIVGSMLGAAAITALGAVATNYTSSKNNQPQWVEIVSSKALTETSTEPQQQCTTKKIAKTAPVQDQHEIAGTVIGAVVGGVLGNQIGGGSGKAAATALGIFGGAILGNNIEGAPTPQTQTVQNCTYQNVFENRVTGYNVTYEFNGKQYNVQLPRDPGPTIKLNVTPAPY